MKHVTLVSITCAAWLLAASAASTVFAAAPAAKVVYATGEVSAIDAGGARRAVQRGDFIASGDTVVTADGRTQLKLTDGAFVALDPNTEYVIETYRFDEASPDSGRSVFNLVRGGVRFVTGAIGKVNRKNWRMRTAVATLGIRGTGAYLRYGDDTLKALFVDVSEGTLEATDPATGEVSILEQGVRYRCSSPCQPIDGPGPARDAPSFGAEPPGYQGGEDVGTMDQDHGHSPPSHGNAPTPHP
jgi:hypothetical protein